MAWAKANKASQHYDVSVRTLRKWQKLGFPFIKIGGTVLFDLDHGDRWLREHYAPDNDTASIVNELMRGLK